MALHIFSILLMSKAPWLVIDALLMSSYDSMARSLWNDGRANTSSTMMCSNVPSKISKHCLALIFDEHMGHRATPVRSMHSV
jgi:hypothetical protein